MKKTPVKQIAVHEAGHAVVIWALGEEVEAIVMTSTAEYEAHVGRDVQRLRQDVRTLQEARLLALKTLCGTLAGPIAELAYGASQEDWSHGASDDIAKARVMASIISPKEDADPFIDRVGQYLAHSVMPSVLEAVDDLALVLQKKKTLKGAELKRAKQRAVDKIDGIALPKTWKDWQCVLNKCSAPSTMRR